MALPHQASWSCLTLNEAARDPQTDAGHYFDQTFFDAHLAMQQARAETKHMLAELDALGVVINQDNDAVTVGSRPAQDNLQRGVPTTEGS